MTGLELQNVSKQFDQVEAVKELSLQVDDGSFVVIVGPSGCGKSTTLRLIAGLEEVTAGDIRMGGQSVTGTEPKDRNIAMVFQNYALYPHMTAKRNMTFGLKSAGSFDDDAVERRVTKAAELLDIEDLLDRKPAALSGGERQRVALGRAIIRDPAVFLMDEPLSNLDAKLRIRMRAELAKLHDELRTTTVYVTHDQTEAMTLGDQVVVMNDGAIQQVAPPQELYDYPANRFVAEFIGDPPMNMFAVSLAEEQHRLTATHSGFEIPLPGSDSLELTSKDSAVLGIRPEDLELADPASNSDGLLEATVTVTEPLGDSLLLECKTGSETFRAHVSPRHSIDPGEAVQLSYDADRLHLFDIETGTCVYHSDPKTRQKADHRAGPEQISSTARQR